MFKIIKRKHDNEMKKTEKEYDIAFRKYLSGDYSDLTREQKKIFCNNKYSFDNTKITLKSLLNFINTYDGYDLSDLSKIKCIYQYKNKDVETKF